MTSHDITWHQMTLHDGGSIPRSATTHTEYKVDHYVSATPTSPQHVLYACNKSYLLSARFQAVCSVHYVTGKLVKDGTHTAITNNKSPFIYAVLQRLSTSGNLITVCACAWRVVHLMWGLHDVIVPLVPTPTPIAQYTLNVCTHYTWGAGTIPLVHTQLRTNKYYLTAIQI